MDNFSSFVFLVVFLKVSPFNWKSKLNKMIQSTTPFNNNNNKTVFNPSAYFVEMKPINFFYLRKNLSTIAEV